MTGRLTIIRPNGTVEVQPIDAEPELEVLQKIVGGYIEVVPGFKLFEREPCIAFCNEEGKLQGLPYNATATVLWGLQMHRRPDNIAGNVAIITGADILRAMTEDHDHG